MPVYEYACTTCGERTEARQSFDDPPLEECPVCGGRLRKLYSPVGIVFKGSGFYSTESKKGAQHRDGQSVSNTDKADKQKAKQSSSSSDGSGDSGSPSGSGSGSSSGSGSKAGSGSTSGSGSSSSSSSEAKSS
jgi:putative FmdB family regulatory protein